jgi:hypothetical protein
LRREEAAEVLRRLLFVGLYIRAAMRGGGVNMRLSSSFRIPDSATMSPFVVPARSSLFDSAMFRSGSLRSCEARRIMLVRPLRAKVVTKNVVYWTSCKEE